METTSKTLDYVLFPNSPIEFAVSGPGGGRDRILVKSANAGLDLIGLTAQLDAEPQRRSSSDLLSLILGKTRQLNLVSSIPLADINPDEDSRSSRFRFAWEGYASPIGMERVKKAFDLQLPELHRAIRNKDFQEIEWALAPLIYQCSEANERRLRSRRMMLAVLAIYAISGLIGLLYLVTINFLKR